MKFSSEGLGGNSGLYSMFVMYSVHSASGQEL